MLTAVSAVEPVLQTGGLEGRFTWHQQGLRWCIHGVRHATDKQNIDIFAIFLHVLTCKKQKYQSLQMNSGVSYHIRLFLGSAGGPCPSDLLEWPLKLCQEWDRRRCRDDFRTTDSASPRRTSAQVRLKIPKLSSSLEQQKKRKLFCFFKKKGRISNYRKSCGSRHLLIHKQEPPCNPPFLRRQSSSI